MSKDDVTNINFKRGEIITGTPMGSRMTSNEMLTLKNEASVKLLNLYNRFEVEVGRWKSPLKNFGAAYYGAHENFTKTLKDRAVTRQKHIDMMFSILGLVCGSSLSWVSSGMKGTARYTESKLTEAVKDNIVGHLTDGIKWGADQGLKQVQTSFKVTVPVFTSTPKNFETELENNFNDQLLALKTFLVSKSSTVTLDDKWADWVYFDKGEGNLSTARQWVDEWIKYLEKEWCQKVYYYRETPNFPPQVMMERIIERAMWANFLQSKIAIRPYVSHDGYRVEFCTGDDIETRLVKLNMMKASNISDRKAKSQAQRNIIKGGGKWSNKSPLLSNPESYTSDDDMVKMANELKNFQPEKIGISIKR